MRFGVAESLEAVVAAWRLVYQSHRRGGLIEHNSFGVHTDPQAIGKHSAVVTGSIGGLCVTTLTAITDSPVGLPLDGTYSVELDTWRGEGRRLMEVALVADRRKQLVRANQSLFQLMRFAFYFGSHQDITDFLVGVPARAAKFYARTFGFELINSGTESNVLMRANVQCLMDQSPRHPMIEYFLSHRLDADAFSNRFRFEDMQLSETVLAAFGK